MRPGLTWALVGLAVVVITALGAWNLSLRSELQSAQTGSRALQGLIAAGAAGGTAVSLAGGTTAPLAHGIAVLHPSGPGYLVVTGLPAAAPGHVYEAWFIRSGEALPAGTFSIGQDGLGVLATPAASGRLDELAVTQEPAGGSTRPTGAIVLSGIPR